MIDDNTRKIYAEFPDVGAQLVLKLVFGSPTNIRHHFATSENFALATEAFGKSIVLYFLSDPRMDKATLSGAVFSPYKVYFDGCKRAVGYTTYVYQRC